MVSLGQIDALRSVLHHGSFTRAAAELRVSRAAVSQRLAALERELGVELLDRSARQLTLSEAGRLLLGRVDPALTRFLDALPRLSGAVVTVGHTITTEVQFVTRLLEIAATELPTLDIRLRRLWTSEACEAVAAGELGLAVVRHPPWTPDLRSELLWDSEFVLRVPRTHPLARRSEVRLEELRDESFLVIPRELSPGTYDLIESVLLQSGIEPRLRHNPVLFTRIADQPPSFRGVSLAPRFDDEVSGDDFRQIRIAGLKQHHRMGVHVVSRQADRGNPVVNALLGILRRIAAEQGDDG